MKTTKRSRPDAINPDDIQVSISRNKAASAAAGAVVGGIVAGPVGAIVGGVVGGLIPGNTSKISKAVKSGADSLTTKGPRLKTVAKLAGKTEAKGKQALKSLKVRGAKKTKQTGGLRHQQRRTTRKVKKAKHSK